MSLFLEAIDLRPLLEDAVQTTRILVADKPITVTLECPAVLPPLTLDRVRMRQVLLNLLSNAAKFTERGSIVVHVVMGDPAILTIQIADSGCGIDSSDQERIFAEFQQVQDVLTRDHQGTGLGLPISKRLVELHGGTMAVTSQVGVGTTFAFNLPVVPPPGIPTSTPESGFASAAEPGGFGNARATTTDILVIDDDPDAHRTLHLVLERAGYQVAHVLDSRTVLPALEAAQPRLVILDIQMPYLDGWEVLAQIKTHARFGRIPVLMCSVVDRQHLGVLLGVQDHLVKPIQPEILIKTVTRWLTAVAAILIVDDDADARQIIARPLLRHGYTVYEAPDGAEGIRIAQQQQPALIILDLMMPGMDGFRVLAAVRADPRLAATPVLVVSAKDLDVQERALLTSQAQGYLTKDLLAVTDMLDLIHPYLQGASPV